MTETDNIIVDAATRIFQDLCPPEIVNEAEAGQWPAELWNTLEESGLTLAWVPDDVGGAGATMGDGFAVLRVAGSFGAPVPIGETLLAGWLLARAGIMVPGGPMTVAPVYDEAALTLAGGVLSGTARHVPWASNAQHIAALARHGDKSVVALVDAQSCAIQRGTSLAGEPRDEVSFDGVAPLDMRDAPDGLDTAALVALGATVRAVQMSGALQKILDQSVQYATERSQFGRPIGKFQAIQHQLAALAGEVAAAGAAADAAAEAFGDASVGLDDVIAEVATAKVRVGEAAGTGAAIAHQVHGAIGFTQEYSLHHCTRRLWAWRDEFGNESAWSIRLGELVAARGADQLWPFVTGG